MAITYYGLFGLNDKKPSGLFREIKNDRKKELHYEVLDPQGEWFADPSLVQHLHGYSDEAEEITEAEALEFIASVTAEARE